MSERGYRKDKYAIQDLNTTSFNAVACAIQPLVRQSSQRCEGNPAVLDAQCAAWNRGDMKASWMVTSVLKRLFSSRRQCDTRWQTVLDRYKRNYDSREKMGTLTFSDLEITPIGTMVRSYNALAFAAS